MKTQDSDARSGEGTLIPQASLTRIEGLPSGRYARKCCGQEGAMKEERIGSKPTWRPLRIVLFEILLVGVTNIALVGVPSRRQVVQKTILGVPDPNLLSFFLNIKNTTQKMSVINLNELDQNDLKKGLVEQIDIEEWINRCR